MVDSDSIIDLITSTIQPTTWDTVGGPGSISFYWPTLDLVFAQTEEAHEEAEELLDRLRKLPVEAGATSELRTAQVPKTTGDRR